MGYGIASTFAGKTLADVPARPWTYYRSMHPDHYDELMRTGRVLAINETFITLSRNYTEGYDGITVELQTQPGTRSVREQIGVRDNSRLTRSLYPNMPEVSKGWTATNAFFKSEREDLVNVGLGCGDALDAVKERLMSARPTR